jgi:hypothetical protein
MRGVCLDQNALQKRNHAPKHFVRLRGRQAAWLLFFLLIAFEASAAEPELRVWLEAKFMGGPVSELRENAQKTVTVAGFWDGNQLAPFSKKDWSKLDVKWPAFEKKAQSSASADFQKMKVSFKRDRRMVIEYAELFSPEGLVSSAVLAPEIGERFGDTLGEVLLFAVPSRSRAFVFPQLGSDVSKYSGLVWDAYRETSFPVSVELFEWRRGSIRAVGLFGL